MSLKKIFYGVFDAPIFQAFRSQVETDLTTIKNKPDTSALDAKLTALTSAVGVLFQLSPMAVWSTPLTGYQNDVITVPFHIHLDALKSLEAFGLEVSFDPAYFQFNGIRRGTLTQAWAGVDANENIPGHLIVGGYVGDVANLSEDDIGSLFELDFTVLGTGGSSVITFESYIDHLKGYLPDPLDVDFEYGQ